MVCTLYTPKGKMRLEQVFACICSTRVLFLVILSILQLVMNFSTIIAVATLLFICFTIGLNLALYGVISFENSVDTKIKEVSTFIREEIQTIEREIETEIDKFPINVHNPIKSAPSQRITEREPNVEPPTQQQEPLQPHSTQSIPFKKPTVVDTPPQPIIQTTAPPIADKVIGTNSYFHDTIHSPAFRDSVSKTIAKIDEQPIGPIAEYINAGKSIPIVLLTCNRANLLRDTIKNLLMVRGVHVENVMVIQDGNLREIEEIVNALGIKLIQNKAGLRLRGGARVDGASAIAMHYKFALSAAFDQAPDAPAIIIVEDDLLFSPDFYEYMHAVGPVLEQDKSALVASAWNDNGFIGKVQDPFQLRRSEFFPGLGWLLPKSLYKGELEAKWPREHWDHWLRSKATHQGREIIYPQMPRTFHNGIRGTFMTLETHNKYFRDIDYNRDTSVMWADFTANVRSPDNIITTQVISDVYEARIRGFVERCKHVNSVDELLGNQKGLYCVWIDILIDGPAYGPPAFEEVATFFGIWHEHRRGAHRGMHEFYWDLSAGIRTTDPADPTSPLTEHADSSYVLLLNIRADENQGHANYRHLMPPSARVMRSQEFKLDLLAEAKRRIQN